MDMKNIEIIMLHKPVTVLLLFIFFIHMKKYVNCSICVYVAHNHKCANLAVGAKLVLRLQAGAHGSCISLSINTIFFIRDSNFVIGILHDKRQILTYYL